MNAVKKDIQALVQKELAAANERFPLFHSPHEGYAVIKEEVEELNAEMECICDRIEMAWASIRSNNSESTLFDMRSLYSRAIAAACEAVQVAAMCEKYKMSAEKWKESGKE